MEIIKGKVAKARKVVVYGPEGIGKSTFAAAFPNPLFIDTEGSTTDMDVARLPRPSSWTMLLEQVRYVKQHPELCGTLVIDTADWAEQLAVSEICATDQKPGIEDFGYGKGYVYLAEAFGKLLNLLEELTERNIHVVLTAHAAMRKFEQPDEAGAYDRWELKLQKKTAPLVKEWADMVLFANYKTYVVNMDNQGAEKGKNKAQGGKRVLYTTHHPCWDAKNRQGLRDELPFEFAQIAHCFTGISVAPPAQASTPPAPPSSVSQPEPPREKVATLADRLPRSLVDLMVANTVTEAEIQEAVAQKGYYPRSTPVDNYDPQFIDGVLVGAWAKVYEMVLANRPAGAQTGATPF